MVSEKVRKICRDIKALKIQGARNVAKAAIHALAVQASDSRAGSADEFTADLIEAADALAATRPTEPMLRNSLRNAIRYLFVHTARKKASSVEELKKAVAEVEKDYLENTAASLRNIAEYGAKEIPDGSTVLTHCHSNTVVGVLTRALELGKEIKVICTETRPLFQGRKTARELADAGMKVTLIIDSAVKAFIKDVDAVLVGADAITSKGELVNKIGTSTIAVVAFNSDIPFYSAAEIYKFDPLTLWGRMEEIEERSPEEVAPARDFKGVTVRNPAFDTTPAKYVTAFFTELGVIPPQSLLNAARKEFRFENPLAVKLGVV